MECKDELPCVDILNEVFVERVWNKVELIPAIPSTEKSCLKI